MRAVFYGWYVVACAFLIAVWGWGLGFYGPAIYLVVLRDVHGWSASTISFAMSAYYLMGAGMIALIGRVVRRFGPMPTILTGVVAMATSVMALTLITEPWQLYLTLLLMAVGWATMSSAMVNMLLAPWFERKRGLAVSLAMNGASFGGVVIAPGVLALVHVVGFQRGLAAATLTMLAMLVPLAATVARRRPEQLGLVPDGDERGMSRADQRSLRAGEQDPEGRAPLRTLGYWTISIPFGLGLAAQVGFLMHEVAFLTPIFGVGPAGIALSITTLAAVVGRVLLGTVIDRMATVRQPRSILSCRSAALPSSCGAHHWA